MIISLLHIILQRWTKKENATFKEYPWYPRYHTRSLAERSKWLLTPLWAFPLQEKWPVLQMKTDLSLRGIPYISLLGQFIWNRFINGQIILVSKIFQIILHKQAHLNQALLWIAVSKNNWTTIFRDLCVSHFDHVHFWG